MVVYGFTLKMRFLFLVLCIGLSACSSLSMKGGAEVNLIGLWEEDNPMVHAVELRNPDGTYMRKEVHRYPSHSPERQSAGRWSVVGDKYNVSLESISSKAWSGDEYCKSDGNCAGIYFYRWGKD